MANNANPVPSTIVEQIEKVGGPAGSDPWWTKDGDSAELLLPDAAVDWIEEFANRELPPKR
ncbi:hypothetical protein ACQE98_10545 [Ornithinimicrobium sp. W1679]|jgi:hypothetical protein|uniref:hypothetical protein n=1 Tax=unclassified Ornithinimicrobium TaxID=2615080 RepID=UPI003CF52048